MSSVDGSELKCDDLIDWFFLSFCACSVCVQMAGPALYMGSQSAVAESRLS